MDFFLIDPSTIYQQDRCCFSIPLPDSVGEGDSSETPHASQLQLMENGIALPHSHSLHSDIRESGGGLYSHWGDTLLFSSTDGSDPRTNGYEYTYRIIKPKKAEGKWVCKEGWDHLFVNHDGSVHLCCNNRAILGNLEESSFDKIWNSEITQHLRLLMTYGEYGRACCLPSCGQLAMHDPLHTHTGKAEQYGMATEEEKSSFSYSSYLEPKDRLENFELLDKEYNERCNRVSSKPVRGCIIPVSRCNLRCPMCTTHSEKMGSIPTGIGLSQKALDQLKEVYPYLSYLEISGYGEIFFLPPSKSPMRQMLRDLGKYASDSLKVVLQTNGTMMNKAWINEIYDCGRVSTISVSADCVRPDIYAYLREGATFSTLRENLDSLLKIGAERGQTPPKIRFTSVISSYTYPYLCELQEFAKGYPTESLYFQLLHEGVDPDFCKNHNIFVEDRAKDLEKLLEIIECISLPSNKEELKTLARCILDKPSQV